MIYLFYPFDDGTAFDTLDDLVPGVGGVSHDLCSPKIGAICRDDGTYLTGLWDVTAADEVYVIGHTAEGMKILGDAQKATIDQTEVVSRIERCNLRRDVNCRIVMYACESGKGGAGSLAAKVADALQNADFACANNVWGFTSKVGMKAKGGSLRIYYGSTWMNMADVHLPSTLLHHLPPH